MKFLNHLLVLVILGSLTTPSVDLNKPYTSNGPSSLVLLNHSQHRIKSMIQIADDVCTDSNNDGQCDTNDSSDYSSFINL